MLDVEAIRQDFPILQRTVHGKPLVYLDNAATSQKPQAVIDALVEYYERYNANIHRGAAHPRRGGDCPLRRDAREGATLHQRAGPREHHLHAQRHGVDQPRRSCLGAQASPRRATR